jgi:hypothetical protein
MSWEKTPSFTPGRDAKPPKKLSDSSNFVFSDASGPFLTHSRIRFLLLI